MNRKIILLPLASFLVLGLGSCGTESSSSAPASSENSSTSASSSETPVSSSSSSSVATTDAIKDINKPGHYTVKGVIVAKCANSVLIDDGTGRITYFNKANCGAYVIGDYYKVVGDITADADYRYGNFQFTSTATFTALDKSKAPAIDTTPVSYGATEFDAWVTAMKAEASTGSYVEGTSVVKGLTPAQRPLVSMRVKGIVSGTYYNYSVDGSTNSGGFTLPDGISIENNKYYDVVGYLYEVVAQKYAYLWATSASEYIPDVVVTAAAGATSLKVGATLQLTATLKNATDPVASWASSDATVATVDASGLVTGVKAGAVTITATTAAAKVGSIDLAVSASYKLSELPALAKGSAFESKGVYMGMNNLEASSKRNSIYVADGAAWYQIYNAATTLIPTGLVVGSTVLHFTGVTADYTATGTGNITTPEATVTELSIVTDASVTAGTPIALNKDNAAVTFAAADVNKEVVIADAVAKTVSVDATYGNVTIVFTVGAGTAEYTLYLDSRYTDVTTIKDLAVGQTFSCKTYVGANKAALRFIFAVDFVGGTLADPTALTIQGASAATTVETGKTLAMSVATVTPSNGDKSVTWAVANKEASVVDPLATIDAATGVLTAGATAGVVVVTATSTKVASVIASVEISIVLPSSTSSSAKYDFTKIPTAATVSPYGALDAAGVLAIFGDSTYLASGTNVVTSVTTATSIYQADVTQGPKINGLKVGKSGGVGTLTFVSSSPIAKVKITVRAWLATKLASLAVNGGTAVALVADDATTDRVVEFVLGASATEITITSSMYSVFTGLELVAA